jgi:hypothetical protein
VRAVKATTLWGDYREERTERRSLGGICTIRRNQPLRGTVDRETRENQLSAQVPRTPMKHLSDRQRHVGQCGQRIIIRPHCAVGAGAQR